jgi:predicted RNA-binding protein
MKYWMIALPRNRMEYCIKVGIFGLNRKYILGNVQEGDAIACYVTKDRKVIGFGEVTKGYYLDASQVFSDEKIFGESNNLYPDRFEFECVQLSVKDEVEFMPVIDKMSFIKNLAFWSVHFSSGITEISKSDWEVLQKQCTITSGGNSEE